jgi:CRISPR-associated protein Csy2
MSKTILVLDTIKVLGANAISSYATIGVPAVTAIGGSLHALERKLKQQDIKIKLNNFAMLYKDVDLQVHKQGYTNSIKTTANPSILKNTAGDIQRPPFNPEAKCHLELSLVISIEHIEDEVKICNSIKQLLPTMKLASGDILNTENVYITHVDESDDQSFNMFISKLMPSFVLIERKDLMTEAMEQGKDAVDALLDNLAVYHRCTKTPINIAENNTQVAIDKEQKFKIEWQKPSRNNSGWIVPIAVGYQGISPLGKAKNTRDSSTPHRFAESIITLGEFKMPYRFSSIDDMLWQYNHDAEADLYCYSQTSSDTEEDFGDDD